MVQANQRQGAPYRDDRLDISSSGKSRSDPARMRARAGQRGRGRHSLDVARDLKRSPTIDEDVRDPHSFELPKWHAQEIVFHHRIPELPQERSPGKDLALYCSH